MLSITASCLFIALSLLHQQSHPPEYGHYHGILPEFSLSFVTKLKRSSSYFEPSTLLSLKNSFNVLDDTCSSIHAPKATSTLSKVTTHPPLDIPLAKKRRGKCRTKQTTSPLRILNVNCRSVVNNKGEFYHMLNELNPDIVVGTESWLTPDIQNSEIFPTELNYSVHRRDREINKIGGGIFILVKNSLVSTRIAETDTNCEILRVKIALNIAKPLLAGSYTLQKKLRIILTDFIQCAYM